MHTSDFDYQLPAELIAQHPPANRSGGRLLKLGADSDRAAHLQITDFPKQLRAGDLMVMNNTRCLLYTSPSPRDATLSRMPSSA